MVAGLGQAPYGSPAPGGGFRHFEILAATKQGPVV